MSRLEHDLLGEREIPDDCLYGVQTARALENFTAAARPTDPAIIRALAMVKIACAQANGELGYLERPVTDAIAQACREIANGGFAGQFPTDALQGGAGTSAHMNVNEVVARRASIILGRDIDPHQHVNLHQSTNDVYPTALRVAALFALRDLERAVLALQDAFQDRERAFASVVKLGRTQLRDAVPTTLGRSFGAFATALARDRWRISKCAERLRVTNLGGTAIGTGIAAPRRYIFLAIEKLREETGLNLSRAENLIDATQNADAFVEVSGILRAHAATLIKIARDLRLLASGPNGGLGEIELPAVQPGSSLMPGKVNPVLTEMVIQAGYRAMAHDYEIGLAAMSGELELNAFLPLIADALLDMIGILARTDKAFAERCVRGIEANPAHCRDLMERSTETLTALIPRIGHARAVELARMMREEGLSVREAVRRSALLPDEEVDALLSSESLCRLGWTYTGGDAT